MTRRLFDSITAADIPADAPMVAGYVDGAYKWSDADWARFPNAAKVRIAISAATNDGHVLDVEQGDAAPADAPFWARERRSAGVDPSVYVNLSNVDAVRAAFDFDAEPLPHLWLAHYDNDPTIPAGFVAKQYANSALSGGHYDLSSVADFWPGVDMTTPTRMGQSAAYIEAHDGDLVELKAVYAYEAHPEGRDLLVKYRAGKRPGPRVVIFYPPVDPDADATQVLDSEPCYFVIDVLP